MRESLKRLGFLLVWVAPILFVLTAVWQQRWMSDDGFINLRIVSNLLEGHGLRFNVSERVEAGTSTLWLAILAALGGVGLRLEDAAIFGGCALLGLGMLGALLGSIWLLGGWRRAMARGALPGGLLVMAALPPVWDYGTSGLEFGLTVAWIGGVWACMGWCIYQLLCRDRWWYVCGGAFFIGLGPLVRPDLAMVSFVFGMTWLVLTRAFWRKSIVLRLGAIGVAAMGLPLSYQIFRMGYYAALTPNTAFAKEAFDSRWEQGWHYVQHLIEPYALHWPIMALMGMGVVFALRRWPMRRDVGVVMAALVSALLQLIYVVKVGGGFMHARLLLPAVWLTMLPALLVPVRRHVEAPSRSHRARFVWSSLLGWMVCLVWAVLCASSWRVSRENVHGIGDERGWYARLSGQDNPYRIEHFSSFSSKHFYVGASNIVDRLNTSCPDVNASECERLLINDVPYQELKGTPEIVSMREGVYGEVKGVAARVPIGMSGFLMGPSIHLVDRVGLAGALSARMILRRRGRPGHEKIMGDAWLYGQFAEPTDGEDEAIRDARAALSCGPLLELQNAISEPMSWERFWENISFSVRSRNLRIPPEPALARFVFCGDLARSLTGMIGARSGGFEHVVCPDSRALVGVSFALNHEEESLSYLQPICEGEAQVSTSFGKRPGDGKLAMFSFTCDEGEALHLGGRGERFVHGLKVGCGARDGGELVGYERGAFQVARCAEHERVIGLQVQSGALIDAVGLICETRSVAKGR